MPRVRRRIFLPPHENLFAIGTETRPGFFDRFRHGVATDSAMVRNVSMYTLHKAKEEIDAVAKHATDIASHVLTLSDDIHVELRSFKEDILKAIDKKFVDLERTIQGDAAIVDSSALADLGAKVSLLSSAKIAAASEGHGSGQGGQTPASEQEHQTEQHRDGSHSRTSSRHKVNTTQTNSTVRRATTPDAITIVSVAPTDHHSSLDHDV